MSVLLAWHGGPCTGASPSVAAAVRRRGERSAQAIASRRFAACACGRVLPRAIAVREHDPRTRRARTPRRRSLALSRTAHSYSELLELRRARAQRSMDSTGSGAI